MANEEAIAEINQKLVIAKAELAEAKRHREWLLANRPKPYDETLSERLVKHQEEFAKLHKILDSKPKIEDFFFMGCLMVFGITLGMVLVL